MFKQQPFVTRERGGGERVLVVLHDLIMLWNVNRTKIITWSLFKISMAGEGHIVIGGVRVFPALGLHILLQRGFLWQPWPKPAQIKCYEVPETKWVSVTLSTSTAKPPKQHRKTWQHPQALSQQASFLCWMPEAAFPITGKPISSWLWKHCSTLLVSLCLWHNHNTTTSQFD